MAGGKGCGDLAALLVEVVQERDTLRAKLRYSQSTIIELQRQNMELDELLTSAQDALTEKVVTLASPFPATSVPASLRASRNANIPAKRDRLGSTWIGGTWLVDPTNNPIIRSAEASWQAGNAQQALAKLTPLVVGNKISPTDRVNSGLLYSSILRSSGQAERALGHTEECVRVVRRHELHALIGKAQFHRGLCFLHLGRYADAEWCFVLGSHSEGYAELSELNRAIAEKKRDELPGGDPNFVLSKGVF